MYIASAAAVPPPPSPRQSPKPTFSLSQLAQVDFLFIHHDGARHQVADHDGHRPADSHQHTHPRRFRHLPLPTCNPCYHWQNFEDRVDAVTLPPPPHLIPILQGSRTTHKDSSIL